jgi:hypothetical protein
LSTTIASLDDFFEADSPAGHFSFYYFRLPKFRVVAVINYVCTISEAGLDVICVHADTHHDDEIENDFNQQQKFQGCSKCVPYSSGK